MLDPAVWEFLRANDAELLPYDCVATAEHAGRLHGAGLIDGDELAEVEEKLAAIAHDPTVVLESDEDVHSAIERVLGPVGRKIHAGRSRNDQVAAALRLYVSDACAEAREEIDALALVTLSFAEAESDTLMPGYTHLQRGQPVTLGHHPLGIDPPDGQMRNSVDAVSDRDFALDYLYAAAMLFQHLSRFGEEIVLWSSSEFSFVRLPETASTGSSMMPQKLNPDVAELVRGKAGTALGRLTGLLATLKGLPLAYDRDLQEDKEPVFAARRDARLGLQAMTVLVSGLEADRERLADAVADPLLLATDVAEDLVKGGIPFRDAHEQVAASVRDGTFRPLGTAAESVTARAAPGPGGVADAIAAARKRFGAAR